MGFIDDVTQNAQIIYLFNSAVFDSKLLFDVCHNKMAVVFFCKDSFVIGKQIYLILNKANSLIPSPICANKSCFYC